MDPAKYNISTRIDGKYAMLSLSGKASEYYLGTDPLTVFEYGNEEKRYAYSYAENPYMDKEIVSDLTFEELQEAFEKMQAEKEKNNNGGLDMDKKTEGNHEYEYQLLDRLRTDCEYFLGAGNRATKNLYTGNVEEQIAKMRELYNILPEKPEWLTEQDIDRYEKLMTTEQVPKAQPAEKKLTALLTIIQGGMTKYLDMGDVSMDDIFRQLKKAALPFVEIKGDVISDEGRFAELEQSGRVSVSVTADIDNDSLTVYETNGVPEEERTKENTLIWNRPKMSNFLKDRVREPKTDNSQHSPFHGVGRSHVSEHEREM